MVLSSYNFDDLLKNEKKKKKNGELSDDKS